MFKAMNEVKLQIANSILSKLIKARISLKGELGFFDPLPDCLSCFSRVQTIDAAYMKG